MKVDIRPFGKADIPLALTLTAAEGWDPTAEFFAACLAHDPQGCFVADSGGQRVGIVTSTRYRASGWVGNLIVAEPFRGRGIGRRLMRQAINCLTPHVATIRLEADPPGIPLYRSLGFADEYEAPRFRIRRGQRFAAKAPQAEAHAGGQPDVAMAPASGDVVRGLQACDMDALLALDRETFGDDRSRLVRALVDQALLAWAAVRRDRVRGYALVTATTSGARIGPVVAEGVETAAALLDAAVAQTPSNVLVVALPGVNAAGKELLVSRGFERTPSSYRMRLGPALANERPQCIFAVANGATG